MSRAPELNRSHIPLPLKYVWVVLLLVLATAGLAASQAMGEHDRYLKAAGQPRMQDRLRELELFASSTETTTLKTQALELMAWYYKQLGDEANANLWARQLLSFDRENPMALAVLVENARRVNPNTISPEALGWAQSGLRRAESFEKPEGMPAAEFAQLRQRMLGILNGTLGYSAFQKQDYGNARTYLRKAVGFMPDDAQFVYALGLANLEGSVPNASEGYWYLARAVNLTQGTPAGREIAQYSANRYREQGGSENDWKQFIASAASAPASREPEAAVVARSTEPQAPAASAVAAAPPRSQPATPRNTQATGSAPATSAQAQPSSKATNTARAATMPTTPAAAATSANNAPTNTARSTGTEVASARPPAPSAASTEATASAPTVTAPSAPTAQPSDGGSASLPQSDTAQPSTSTSTGASAPQNLPPSATPSAGDKKKASDAACRISGTCPEPERSEVAMLTVPPPPAIQRPPLSPRDPVSLGILIEAAVANDENRSAMIYALVDLVRHLRSADEAFILSFGQQLEFQQDLTQNYDLLEAAIQGIKPDEGAALLDAVGFASGHLARIARNRNRVLIVISDGRDFGSRTPGYEVTGQIDQSGVRIYSIGVGVMDSGDRSRLEQLTSRTGGRTVFVESPLHFRAAARQIASGLGIEFPM